MKNYFIFAFIFLNTIIGYSQNYIVKYDNGQIKIKGDTLNGKQVGTWEYYKADGKIDIKLVWIDSVNANLTKYSLLSQKVYETGPIANGKNRFGHWKIYDYKKGYLKTEGEYVNGNFSGKWTVYDKDGKVEKIINGDDVPLINSKYYDLRYKLGDFEEEYLNPVFQ